MKRLVMFLALFSLLVGGGFSQSPAYKTGIITATASTCTATACVSLQIPANSSSATIQLTNTFTGTVQFETSPDGVTFAAILGTPIPSGTAASSSTATGLWRFQVAGLTWIRARASAYTSGQIGVRINTTLGVSSIIPVTGGGINGSGSANTLAKFTSSPVIGNSALTDDGSILYYPGVVGLGAATPAAKFDIQGTASTDLPTYSAEFLGSSGWTSTDWTGSFAAGWTHTTGNTTVLSSSTAAVAGVKYQIAFTVTGMTAGTFTVSFGGTTFAGYNATNAIGPTATSTAGLQITPTTDFNGTIVISIKSITAMSTPLMAGRSSDGTEKFQLRDGSATFSLFMGEHSGGYHTTGNSNNAFGWYAGKYLTTGYYNSIFGSTAGRELTTGYFNSLFGESAGMYLTNGYRNSAHGVDSLASLTSGFKNSGLGDYSGYSLTTGNTNVFLGSGAGYNASQKVDAVNSVALGSDSYTTKSNQIVYGNSNVIEHLFQSGLVGVGVTPEFSFHIGSITDPAAIAIDGYGAVGINLIGRRAQGTVAVPTAVQSGDNIFTLQGRGYGATAFATGSKVDMRFFAAENWTDAAQGTYITLNTTPIGSTTRAERLRVTNVAITAAPPVVSTVTSGEAFSDISGTTSAISFRIKNTGADVYYGAEGSGAGSYFTDSLAYGTVIYGTTSFQNIINGSTKFTILASGNVGIGTKAPPTTLFVAGAVATGSYTDSSNYEYGSLISTAGALTLAANTLGTGTDNINIVLSPAGTGKIVTGGQTGITASGTACTITAITNGIVTGATCTP